MPADSVGSATEKRVLPLRLEEKPTAERDVVFGSGLGKVVTDSFPPLSPIWGKRGIALKREGFSMHMLQVWHSKRVIGCLGLLGALTLSSGCDSSAPPVNEIQAAKNGEHGEAEKQARLKAYGTANQPKSELPKR